MNEYNLILRTSRWLRRFRKRRGYGVHSPFAFDLITGVIYNDEAYYAYERLRQPLAVSITRLDEYDPVSGLTAKDLRLLFRLANWAEPTTLLLRGASPTVEAYITAARPSARLVSPSDETALPPTSAPAARTFVYCDSPAAYSSAPLSGALSQESPTRQPSLADAPQPEGAQSVIVVRGIHADEAARQCWEQLKAHSTSTVTFDLGRFGIIVSAPKINRQHYIVNYF